MYITCFKSIANSLYINIAIAIVIIFINLKNLLIVYVTFKLFPLFGYFPF